MKGMLRLVCLWLIGLTISAKAGDVWSDPANPVRAVFKGARLDLWSLQPIKKHAVPALSHADSSPHPVDRFLVERLKAAGLAPAPAADRRTLGRRLAYALTGLPPDERVLAAFGQDNSPGSYERLVDTFLASPDFGIHWARMWLDTVRYSDSNGYDWDEFRPSAWRYRDYVVRALQQDKPFDQFIREQLAGDELVEGAPKDQAAQDRLIATGYLRMGPQDNSAKLFGEEHRARAAIEADMAETTATAFLGMTLRCCRCHDHKTDPLTHEDHYRLRAFFSGVKLKDDVAIDLAPEQEKIRASQEAADASTVAGEAEKLAIMGKAKTRLAGMANQKPDKLDDKEVRNSLTADERAVLAGLDENISKAKASRMTYTVALGVSEDRDKALEVHVLSAGDPDQPRQPVAPGVFTVFRVETEDLTAKGSRPASRRLALADWITTPENPLTARVIVNRIWQQCFGDGIVGTADDFGYTGTRPTHPELLDWLAVQFVKEGWSVKRLVRQLVTSSAWQQTAWVADGQALARGMDADSPGSLLWKFQPRRLTAEQVRDSLLGLAGRLTENVNGPPVWPELPAEILQANPAFFDDNAEKTKGWYPSTPEQLHVRSLRLVQKRSLKIPFMETFGQPDNFESCTRRVESTGAPQALTLMNSPLTVEAVHAAAARIRRDAGDSPEAQIKRAFTVILQRAPDATEQEACLVLLRDRSLAEVCRVLVNTSEFLVVD